MAPWQSQDFSSTGNRAGLALVATAGLASAVITSVILVYVIWHALMTTVKKSKPVPRGVRAFARSSLGLYLLSLLLCDLCQGVAFALNYHWVVKGIMSTGTICTIQGAVSELGDLGAAIWSMAIALHTFSLLFLVRKPHPLVAPTFLFVGWTLLIILPIIGPLAIRNEEGGPFYNLSGAWCWIGENYAAARVGYLYGWIFSALASSIVSYTLIYLRFSHIVTVESNGKFRINWGHSKSNVVMHTSQTHSGARIARHSTSPMPGCFGCGTDSHDIGDAISIRGTGDNSAQLSDESTPYVDDHLKRIARRLMWYPFLYAIVVLPASVCRMGVLAGWEPPFALFVFAGVCFGSSGITNSVLFITTRHSFIKQVMKPNVTTRVQITTQRVTVREEGNEEEGNDLELSKINFERELYAPDVTKSLDGHQDNDSTRDSQGKNRVSIVDYASSPTLHQDESEGGFHVTVLGK